MDDLQREKELGFDLEYLSGALEKMVELGDKHKTPGFGLAAQLFSCMAKNVFEALGPEKGEELIKEAVEAFGLERGKRIAERVKADGLPLSFRNWLAYTDIDSTRNFQPEPNIENEDLVVKVENCTFYKAAHEWGLGEYARFYCKYVDYAILEGYNPEVKLVLEDRFANGSDHCIFRYVMKDDNK